jgi:hypothetical protein
MELEVCHTKVGYDADAVDEPVALDPPTAFSDS